MQILKLNLVCLELSGENLFCEVFLNHSSKYSRCLKIRFWIKRFKKASWFSCGPYKSISLIFILHTLLHRRWRFSYKPDASLTCLGKTRKLWKFNNDFVSFALLFLTSCRISSYDSILLRGYSQVQIICWFLSNLLRQRNL